MNREQAEDTGGERGGDLLVNNTLLAEKSLRDESRSHCHLQPEGGTGPRVPPGGLRGRPSWGRVCCPAGRGPAGNHPKNQFLAGTVSHGLREEQS